MPAIRRSFTEPLESIIYLDATKMKRDVKRLYSRFTKR